MKIFRLKAFLLIALIGVASGANVNAQTIQLQTYLSGLSNPVLATNAKDGSNRVFVVEQSGAVKVAQPGSTTTTVFINLAGRLVSGGERGLLGLAFHPQFETNGKFYVYYTCLASANPTACPANGDAIISEFTVSAGNPNVGDPNSERVLLKIPDIFSNHNGGMIEFGQDGFLYIGTGDGGSGNDPGNRAQNRSVLLGKMLRIDVTASGGNAYTIPGDNPYVGANTARCDNGGTNAGTTCREIYATGLRNPFRWSFDRQTGQLFAGDVGQNVLEEIDIIQSGGNYGWRVYEANQCTNLDPSLCNPANYIAPIAQYNHTAGRCSVTGGYVYRGRRGTFTRGTYLYGDYCTGEIWKLENTGSSWVSTFLISSGVNISSFGEDEAGEIYVCDIGGGTVRKIVNPSAVALRNAVADFDGDLKTDVSVFRPSNGYWYYENSLSGNVSAVQFGSSGDKIVPGDYDSDGKTDVAVFRGGTWFLVNSSNNTFQATQFGTASDVPVQGDYDGDGRTDIAVYRASIGTWYIQNSSNNAFRAVQFGANTDLTVPADYDGDGRTDIAVLRPANNTWYVLQSQSNSLLAVQWGAAGDVPVTGDYNGDGKADVAVWRPSNGTWFSTSTGTNTFYYKQWGASGDVPQPGDYDGDGKTDPAVTRNAGGSKTWFISRSFSNSLRAVQFGGTNDIGVPATDVP